MQHALGFRRLSWANVQHLSAGERVCAFLRALHPARTAQNVHADTRGRIAVKTIERMLERESAPSLDNFIHLSEAYGSALLVATFGPHAPDGLEALAREQQRSGLDDEIAALVALRDELA
ncbi:hypothetical protein [Chenggangzhangella methanolivorans]|uniref:Uncharacterized protein n=1 Tax=Chenggangzhangella methanolivorans TaxID=1437009 RepID=A0A9E6RA92_9HYPH|nr:hypothetical protein [Chenggangzhangella methanolivorans]QZN99517.1 hypothetical protein K6K41_22855 [Chenggangzhangella methanolivorans]